MGMHQEQNKLQTGNDTTGPDQLVPAPAIICTVNIITCHQSKS